MRTAGVELDDFDLATSPWVSSLLTASVEL